MKIFHVIDSKNFGGIKSHIIHLSQYLKNKKEEPVVVFLTKYKTNLFRDLLIEKGINYCEGNLKQIIKKNKTAIFHSHGYKANIMNKFYKLRFNHGK